jgi:spermidine synthase
VVGGLGLGFTAAAALKFTHLSRLIVVEALQPVIDWHRQGLVPNGETLSGDPRCEYLNADFFALSRSAGFDAQGLNTRFDAVLLDIDHTPSHVLNSSHAEFYSLAGLRNLTRFIKPNGIFALWSDEAPDSGFLDMLEAVFGQSEGHLLEFHNPLQNATSTNGIYLARLIS